MKEAEKNKVKSVAEFLEKVFEKINPPEKKVDLFNVFWFRGESCDYKDTALVPSAYRDIVNKINTEIGKQKYIGRNDYKYSDIENRVKIEFERKALPYISSKNIENTDWNRYFLMQHYNINTRLLDWTEDAIKALFFAIKDTKNTNHAKVWILQPFILNRFTLEKIVGRRLIPDVIPPLSKYLDMRQDLSENGSLRLAELTRRYLTMDFYNDDKSYYPLAINPPFLDERMSAQKTCFTIFGDEFNGFHEVYKSQNKFSPDDKILDYVIIDGKNKKEMLKQLQLIGIDDSSIYPDLDGLGISIKTKYKDAYKDTNTITHFIEKVLK